MKYPLTALNVLRIQKRLKELSIYLGKLDGDEGPLTLKAIRGFQRINGLKPDGIVGPVTEAELFPAVGTRPEEITTLPKFAPAPPRRAIIWPNEAGVSKYYGAINTNQTTLQLPFRMFLAWDLRKSVKQFSIHEKVHDSALRCFNRIADAYPLPSQRNILGIDKWGGCLNPRKKRGGSSWSMHSWGIAIDFDPERNSLRMNHTQARLAQPDAATFWRIWEEEGWLSLGRARDFDWMHVQATR